MVLAGSGASLAAPSAEATTPIQHLVVIFQENVSFDHYFGTIRMQRTRTGKRSAPSPARNGRPMTLDERMEDMLRRHGLDSPNARAHAQRVPYLRQAVRRTLEICRSLDKRRTGRFNGAVDRLTLP
jgi:phospholipase C